MLMTAQPDDELGLNRPSLIPPHDAHMAATLTTPIMAAPEPIDLSPLMAQSKMPDTGGGMSRTVNPPTPLDREESHLGSRLMADYHKDEDPWGSPDNHSGFLGKFLHGLNVATGGVNRRAFEEQGLEGRLNNLSKLESEEGLQGAQAGNLNAEAGRTTEETNEMPGKTASEEGLQGAQAANLQSETRDRDLTASYGPQLATAYAHAVNTALKEGRDPAQDPIVRQISDAITSIQRQPATPPGTKVISREVGGKPHNILIDERSGADIRDEGESGEKPPTVRVETPGEERSAKNDLLKAYQPTLDSAERMNVMTDAYEKAVKDHDQQAMLNLLANHLGMTMGLQKGSRLTRDIIREAQASRPWLEGMEAKFDKDGYLTGVTLTPQQMRQMVNLAQERYAEDAGKSRATARYLGGKDDGPDRVPGTATKNYYLGLSGGDKNKALELMRADGWTVPGAQ
jgi:hypothetical protein